ncbi:MAG: hypothetical protein ACE5OZ_01280 [Candidatus Heimdallarchaeota archaeon]
MGWPFLLDRPLSKPSPTDEKMSICNCPQSSELLYDPVAGNHVYVGCCEEVQVCAKLVVAKHLATLKRNSRIIQSAWEEAG